jgi:hypothetical protein
MSQASPESLPGFSPPHMGDATNLERPGVRRMLVNVVYWAVGLEHKISPDSNVNVVGEYELRKFA